MFLEFIIFILKYMTVEDTKVFVFDVLDIFEI